MIDGLTIFVNTHSSAADCWPMFFGQLHRHWSDCPAMVVADDNEHRFDFFYPHEGFPKYGRQLVSYSPAKKFTNQYLMGLCAVETPYVLTAQEDFLLYGDVDEAAIRDAMGSIGEYSCVRLIDSGRELEYSMQASVWATQALKLLYASAELPSPWEAEMALDAAMRSFGMKCLHRRDDDLPMRGRDHRDSPVFPYISTALVKSKWNAEYHTELAPLLEQYGIDPQQRGWSA